MSIRPQESALRPRDPRLDFFRGFGMFIILIAHIPTNPWADWIPARFGFSDATEIFVFCSGVASAIAFGKLFDRAGWMLGTARILHRIWQVYWCHLGVFIATVVVLAAADLALGTERYLRQDLNLWPFLEEPVRRLVELAALAYVPNYFDILPMYLVILGLVPVIMAAARMGIVAVGAVVGGLWVLAANGLLEFTAESWSGRSWFFNPFSWQLLFFLGFALGRGWLVPPSYHPRRMAAAFAGIALGVPFSCQYGWSCFAGWGQVPWFGEVHQALFPLIDKTHLGVLRVVHFIAVAYVAYMLAGEGGHRLRGIFVAHVQRVGRQTLAVFLAGLVLAQALGVLLDVAGRSLATVTLVNLGGCALLMLVAAAAEWFKSSPWSKTVPRREAPAGAADHEPIRVAQALKTMPASTPLA
jgi:hypothetical protein